VPLSQQIGGTETSVFEKTAERGPARAGPLQRGNEASARIDLARETYISLFCRGNYFECARKKLKDSCQKVPEKLLPDGQYL
jgi:hypothetical protein